MSDKLAVGRASADTKDMGRLYFRIELHVISAPGPGIASVTQQIVHFILFALNQTELLHGNVDEGILSAMRIQIDHDQDHVIARRRRLSVKENGVIVGLVKSKIVVH